MSTFVLVHGSWFGGWCWQRVLPYLRTAGHTVYTPTLTGMGERSHLRAPTINLSCYIQDVINVILYEDLQNVILVGHSYAGMVITGVADRIPSRLSQLVYLDAFVPENGESNIDLLKSSADASPTSSEPVLPDSWFVPPPESVEWMGVTNPEDVEWLKSRLTPETKAGTTEKLLISNETAKTIPRTFILCTNPQLPPFARAADRIREESGWQYLEIEAGHAAMVTAPKDLAELLDPLA